MTKEKKSLWLRICSIVKPDWLFALILVFSGTLLIAGNVDQEVLNLPASEPMPRILILAGVTLLIAYGITFAARFDRRTLDDYYFQVMAQSAIISVVTSLFVFSFWGLAEPAVAPLRNDDLMAVMLGSWAMGYFFFRLRGLTR